MKIRFLKPAQFELEDAVAWYDSHSVGLGTQFLDDLDRTVRRIVAYPFSSPEIEPGLRRCLLSRFPYGIIYGVPAISPTPLGFVSIIRTNYFFSEPIPNSTLYN